MKAATYIKRIKEDNACSIHTAEKLTEALHREGILHPDLAIRFRPLFGDFDVVHKEWLNGNDNVDMTSWYLNPFKDPDNIIPTAKLVNELYKIANQ